MRYKIKIPREHIGSFATLRDLGPAGIDALAEAIPSTLLRVSDLESIIRELGIEDAPEVASLLITVANLYRTENSVLEDVTESIRQTAEWHDQDLMRWEQVRPSIASLVSGAGLVALTKALHLQYDSTNMLTEARVVTDVRPVFDRDASIPLSAIICHTLRLAYRSSGETRNLELAIDTADLKRMVREAERALAKAEALSQFLRHPTPLPHRIAGDEDGT